MRWRHWPVLVFGSSGYAIGVIGGAGIGLAYVCPVAACVKWFPDLRGLITGLAVAGFGGGAFLFIKLAGNWGGLIARDGVSGTWLAYAAIFALAITAGAALLRNPPRGWRPAGWSPPQVAASGPVANHEFTQGEAIRTRPFWILWVAFLFAGGCGMMVISSLKDFGVQEGGLSEAQADGALGLLALFNALGRINWGWVSQWLTPRRTLVLISMLQAIMVVRTDRNGWQRLDARDCRLLGRLSLRRQHVAVSALTAEYFGTRHLGANYGLVFTGYGVGGVVGPMLAGQVWDWTHSYYWAFVPAAAGCLLAMVLALALGPLGHRRRLKALSVACAFSIAFCSAGLGCGNFRPSDSIVLVTISATSARAPHFASAGITCHGAHFVLVAVIAAS